MMLERVGCDQGCRLTGFSLYHIQPTEDTMNESLIVVSTTVENKADAERLASILIERRLVACAQISSPLTSMYRWQGKIVTAEEFLLTLKTRKSLYETVAQVLRQEHPYQVPEVICQEVEMVDERYSSWITEETK
jgi:periplasmic divalent cation tolerance protein